MKDLVSELSNAIQNQNKNLQKAHMLLLSFFSRLPLVIKIGSLDSTADIFQVLAELVHKKGEREKITNSIQNQFAAEIFELSLPEQDLIYSQTQKQEIELSERDQSNINIKNTRIPSSFEEIDDIQSYIGSQLSRLIDLFFSFTHEIQRRTSNAFLKLISAFPQQISDLFPKILEYHTESSYDFDLFVQLANYAMETNPDRIITMLFKELQQLNESTYKEMEDRIQIIENLIQILYKNYRLYPEIYWNYLDNLIELLNPKMSVFSTEILEILIFFAKKGAGELLFSLESFLYALDIEGINLPKLLQLLREINDLIEEPEFKDQISQSEQVKSHLYLRINDNFDENSQVCYDILMNIINNSQDKGSELRKILEHLIEKKITDPYFWIQFCTNYMDYRTNLHENITIPDIYEYIPLENLEEQEIITKNAISFREAWKNN